MRQWTDHPLGDHRWDSSTTSKRPAAYRDLWRTWRSRYLVQLAVPRMRPRFLEVPQFPRGLEKGPFPAADLIATVPSRCRFVMPIVVDLPCPATI